MPGLNDPSANENFSELPADPDAVARRAQEFGKTVASERDKAWSQNRYNNAEYIGAGVGVYNAVQKFRASDMGDDARRELAIAGQTFADAWGAQHGFDRGTVHSEITFDRNGEPHVRLMTGKDAGMSQAGEQLGLGGSYSGVANFSYDNMVSFLRKKGYLDQADAEMRSQLGIAPPQSSPESAPAAAAKPMTEADFYKTIKGLPEWAVDDFWNQNGDTVFGKERSLALRGKYNAWRAAQASQVARGGKPSTGGGGSASGGDADDATSMLESGGATGGGSSSAAEGDDAGVSADGAAWEAEANLQGDGDNGDAAAKAANGTVRSAADAVLEGDEQKKTDLRRKTRHVPGHNDVRAESVPGGASLDATSEVAPAREPEPYMVGEANLRDEKQLARVEANLKKQGFVVREVNGEYYMWHPQAKVWMAADGHTVVERNGTLVDSGVAPNKLQYDTDVKSLTAKGPGGQGDAEVTTRKRRIVEDIPENFIKYLQFKNNQNGLGEEYLSQDSGVNQTGYEADDSQLVDGAHGGKVRDAKNRTPGKMGKTVETDSPLKQREWNRIAAFENGPNGANGAKTVARRFNTIDRTNERGIVRTPEGEINVQATNDAANKNLEEALEAFDKLSPEGKMLAWNEMDDFGRQKLSAARNLRRVNKAYDAIAKSEIKSFDDLRDAVRTARTIMVGSDHERSSDGLLPVDLPAGITTPPYELNSDEKPVSDDEKDAFEKAGAAVAEDMKKIAARNKNKKPGEKLEDAKTVGSGRGSLTGRERKIARDIETDSWNSLLDEIDNYESADREHKLIDDWNKRIEEARRKWEAAPHEAGKEAVREVEQVKKDVLEALERHRELRQKWIEGGPVPKVKPRKARRIRVRMPSDGSDLSVESNERIKTKYGVDVNATA